MKLLCVGDLMVDVVVYASTEAVFGDETQTEFRTRPGGQAFNVARAYRRLGAKSALQAAVGRDLWAAWLRRKLRQEGIRLWLQRAPLPTGMVASRVSGEQRTMYSQRGADVALKPRKFKQLGVHDTLYLSGYLLQTQRGQSVVTDALEQAKKKHLFTAIDTPPAQLLRRIGPQDFLDRAQGIDTFLATDDEAQLLTGQREVELMARCLGQRFALVIVKQGPQGCWVQQRGVGQHVPTVPLDNVDPTGAGDAFCGGLLYALGQGLKAVDAARFAHRVAAQTIGRRA